MMDALAKLPVYDEYKRTRIKWLEEVPSHWDEYPICSKAKLKSITNKVGEDLLSVYLDKGVIRFDEVEQKRTNVTSLDLSKYQLVEVGDFVLNNQQAWRGSVGVSSYRGIVSPAYLVLSLAQDLLPNFANYLFRDGGMVSHYLISSKGVGTIQRNLYWPQLKRAPLFIPPVKEQVAIANFLDQKTAQIDEAIAIKDKQIALLKERKQIIIQKAVTQGLNPDVKMKESGVDWIGQVPAHWDLTRLKFHSKIQSGITLGKSYRTNNPVEVPYIRVANVQFGYFKLDDVAVLNLPKREIDRYLLQDKDILVTEGGDIDKLGRGTVWNSEVAPCIHQNHVFAIRIDLNKFRHDFVAGYLASDSARKHFISTATKTTNLASTNRTHLGNVYLPIPSLKEQDEINAFIAQKSSLIDTAVTDLENQIGKLKEYKATLINSAVTGKIKVA